VNGEDMWIIKFHKFAPLVGVHGDMEWTSSLVRRQTHMIRHWNHLLKLDNGRLTKRVFKWDRQQGSLGWAYYMKKLRFIEMIGLTSL